MRSSTFNRERLILAAMQNVNQLYYMMDTRFEGLYQIEAKERRKEYGDNRIVMPKLLLGIPSLPVDEIKKLLAQWSQLTTSVFRKGVELYTEVDSYMLVPGDVIFLTAGDIVPADVRIIFDRDFFVDQFLLSSRKEVLSKGSSIGNYTCTMSSIAGLPDIGFAGSLVKGGMARAVVIGTGSGTYLSDLLHTYA